MLPSATNQPDQLTSCQIRPDTTCSVTANISMLASRRRVKLAFHLCTCDARTCKLSLTCLGTRQAGTGRKPCAHAFNISPPAHKSCPSIQYSVTVGPCITFFFLILPTPAKSNGPALKCCFISEVSGDAVPKAGIGPRVVESPALDWESRLDLSDMDPLMNSSGR